MPEDRSSPPHDPNDSPGQKPAASPPPRKRKRRWLRIVLGVCLVLVILVLLAPAILSTGFGRGLVIGQINKSLNGKLRIDDWSLGWFTGTRVKGLSLTDAEGQPCLKVGQVNTPLTLLKALFGSYALGDVTIKADFTFKTYADGTNNFSRLIKNPSPPQQVLRVPSMSFNITLDGRGTYVSEGRVPVQLPSVKLTAKTPNINEPIEYSLSVDCRGADGSAGGLATSGKIALFRKNELNLEALNGDVSLELKKLPLAVAAGVLPASVPVDRLDGVANGTVAASFADGKRGSIQGQIAVGDVAAYTGAAGGPTTRAFASRSITITIPKTVLDAPKGLDQWQSARLSIGGGNPITIKTDQGSATLVADLTLGAMLNSLANQKPGSSGMIEAHADIGMKEASEQLPGMLHIADNVKINQGRLIASVIAKLMPDHSEIDARADLKGVQGTKSTTQPAGAAEIKLDDITLTASAGNYGGGGMIPDMRAINLGLSSAFATLKVGGDSLANLSGGGSGDLKLMQDELGKVFNFGELKLAGRFTKLEIASKGDLSTETGSTDFTIAVPIDDLVVAGLTENPISEKRVSVDVKGTLRRGKLAFVESGNATATALAGPADARTLDVVAKADFRMVPAKAGAAAPLKMRMTLDVTPAKINPSRYGILASTLKPMGLALADTSELASELHVKDLTSASGAEQTELTGQVAVTPLRLVREGKQIVHEDTIPMDFDLLFSDDFATAEIRKLTLKLGGGQALRVAAGGRITNLRSTPIFNNVQITINSNTEKLMPLLTPFLGPSVADLKLGGVIKDQVFAISGSYAMDARNWREAIRPLRVSGGLALDVLDISGLKFQRLNVQLTLADGVFTVHSPQPAMCSGGTVSLDGIRLNLAADSPRLSIRSGPLVRNVKLNAIMANVFFANANFLFHKVSEATGTLNIGVIKCDDVPMAWLTPGSPSGVPTAKVPGGSAEIAFSLDEGGLGSGPLMEVLKLAGGKFGAVGLTIKGGRFGAADGLISSELPLTIDRQTLVVSAVINMPQRQIVRGEFRVPRGMTRLGTDLRIPVRGSISLPLLDVENMVKESLTPEDIGNIVGGLKDKKDDKKDSGATQPAAKPKKEAVPDLLKLIPK